MNKDYLKMEEQVGSGSTTTTSASSSTGPTTTNPNSEPNKISHFLLEEDFENKKRFSTTQKRVFYLLTSLVILAAVVLLIVFLLPRGWEPPKKRTNIIMMIGDGMGPAALTMARVCFKKDHETGIQSHLHLDPYVVGTVKTYSSDSIVTDSAAAATAYASAFKTYNGAVGVDSNKKPIATVMEAAKQKGMKTGLVVTTRISDATPACYFSHSVHRQDEAFIITQLLDRQVDIVLGGGKRFFTDAILANASSTNNNYTMVYNKNDMFKVEKGKIMGLFADDNIAWEVDRLNDPTLKETQPSLQEMTTKALELISQNNEEGFLLMVEGSKIDVAGHINDAATQIWETNAFDETFEIVRQWAEKDGNTIVIVTADHETGGLTLANQPIIDGDPLYIWEPEKLLAVKKSADSMASLINKGANISELLFTNAGINLTAQEFKAINDTKGKYYMNQVIGRIISNYANIGFTTGGHTGEDVNLYTFGDQTSESKFESLLKNKELDTADNFIDPILRGNINNIDIASFIIKTLDLKLEPITQALSTFDPLYVKPTTPIPSK